MKVLVIFALLILAALAAWYVSTYVKVALARRRHDRTPWEIKERTDSWRDVRQVYLVRPGEPDMFIGGVSITDPEFSQRIEDLRSEAEEKLVAVNRPLLRR